MFFSSVTCQLFFIIHIHTHWFLRSSSNAFQIVYILIVLFIYLLVGESPVDFYCILFLARAERFFFVFAVKQIEQEK